jgi:type IV pilus assembly protein PilQ
MNALQPRTPNRPKTSGRRGIRLAGAAGSLSAMWGILILLAAGLLLPGCGSHKVPGAETTQHVELSSITPAERDGGVELTIEGSNPILQYTSFQLTEPLRLVIDITDADLGKIQDKIAVNQGAITDIVPSQVDNVARLEIGLTDAVDTKVSQNDGKLVVDIGKPAETSAVPSETAASAPTTTSEAAPAAAAAVPAASETAPETKEAPAKVVTAIKAMGTKEGATVVIKADGQMKPNVFMIKEKRLVIDVPGAKSRVKPRNIPVRKGGLDMVRVGQHPDKVRVVLDLKKPMEYTVTPEGNTLVVSLTAATAVAKSEAQPQEHAAVAAPAEAAPVVAQREAEQQPAGAEEAAAPAVPSTQAAEGPAAAAGAAEEAHLSVAQKAAETSMLVGSRRYTGRRISLDLQDADLVNVLRLFGELANLNMILSPEVRGKVTVRLVNIPWDQAMEIILKMNGLGYAIDDNIIRIASQSALAKEADEELRTKEAKKKAEDLVTRLIPINYSTASVISGTIKKSLSSRGDVVVDDRTNTLIVKDIQRNVDEIVELVKRLDKPTAQIMIEARIVEASLNFSRSLGIQWGGNFAADAAHNNATGWKFPNTIGVTGGPTMGTVPSGNGNFFVNMPAPAGAGTGGGAIGMTFGSLNKALSLDLVLSALESTGEGKIISSPRVSALDNKEAKIEQGLSIPFATSQAGGATNIQFIDAKLSLIVTPHATPDNKIFMKIQATKNAPDTSLLGANGQPSIRKNEATTEILLSDGETAVIGGILTLDRGTSEQKVPFLADIPIIGWLFKSRSTTEQKQELIIFITPRVVKQDVI